jgi:hypothetical protein
MEEVYASVVATTTSGNESRLPRRKSERFDSRVEYKGVLFASRQDNEYLALAFEAASTRCAGPHSDRRFTVTSRTLSRHCRISIWRLQQFLRAEDEHLIVITAYGEVFAISTPSQATNLLSVTAYPGKKCHAAMPIEKVAMRLIRPFDSVQVHIADLIADQEFFCLHHYEGLPY